MTDDKQVQDDGAFPWLSRCHISESQSTDANVDDLAQLGSIGLQHHKRPAVDGDALVLPPLNPLLCARYHDTPRRNLDKIQTIGQLFAKMAQIEEKAISFFCPQNPV